MMRILAVGNSFSTDATRFLHQVLAERGVEAEIVNLYIGGCSLERHVQNLESGEAAYEYQRNGAPVLQPDPESGEMQPRMVSLQEAFAEGGWDVVVTQQCSPDSGWMESYEPFLTILLGFFRENAPGAKLYFHETWAYDTTSPHRNFLRYNRDQQEMYTKLCKCYTAMAEKHGLTLIPSGDAVQAVRQAAEFNMENGGRSLTRDGFHMSWSYGRYLLALMWAKTICGVKPADSRFVPVTEEEPVEEPLLNVLRQVADTIG